MKLDKVWLRVIPIVAFKLTLVVLGLGLTTLLAGITGNRPNAAAIFTFHTSSLGLEAYHDPSSQLYANVSALIPSDLINPPSITKYLGAHDWYTMHYYTNCSGFFAPSTTNPSVLTSNKVNITCSRQISGYTWDLHDVIQSTLLPSVKGVASTVSTAQYQTSTSSSLWYTGLSNAFITVVELPWNFTGRRPWLNFWEWWNAFISTAMLLSSAALVTNQIVTVHHASGLPGPNPGSGTFLGIMWSTVALMSVVCGMLWVQWRMEPTEGCCREEGETRVHGNARPIEEWKSENTFVNEQKV